MDAAGVAGSDSSQVQRKGWDVIVMWRCQDMILARLDMGWLIHAPRPGADEAVFTQNCQAALGRERRWAVTVGHRRWRAAGRWACAVGAALAVFFLIWWAWYVFRWPPVGASRLAVALPVAAVVSAVLSGPLFFWAGQPPRSAGCAAVFGACGCGLGGPG